MNNNPLIKGDDILILQLLDIVATKLKQLLNQGMILENPEVINQTQQKIDQLQQLERLRIVLRKQREGEKRRRQLSKTTA